MEVVEVSDVDAIALHPMTSLLDLDREVLLPAYAKEVQSCFEEMGIGTIYIDPGSPWQNGHIESFSQSTA